MSYKCNCICSQNKDASTWGHVFLLQGSFSKQHDQILWYYVVVVFGFILNVSFYWEFWIKLEIQKVCYIQQVFFIYFLKILYLRLSCHLSLNIIFNFDISNSSLYCSHQHLNWFTSTAGDYISLYNCIILVFFICVLICLKVFVKQWNLSTQV